jgi:hypothetical protein
MADFAEVLKELKRERKRLDQAIKAVDGLVGRNHTPKVRSITTGRRRKMSAKARRRIAAAQRERWAIWRRKRMKRVA